MLILNGHLHSSGVLTDGYVRADIEKMRVLKNWTLCSKLLTILDLIVNSWADLYDHLMFERIITLTKNKKIRRKTAMGVIWTWNHVALIVHFMSYEKWVQT